MLLFYDHTQGGDSVETLEPCLVEGKIGTHLWKYRRSYLTEARWQFENQRIPVDREALVIIMQEPLTHDSAEIVVLHVNLTFLRFYLG